MWVIGHEDGTVDVLSGFDTHVPFNLGKLLWWCPTARGLEDVSHGNEVGRVRRQDRRAGAGRARVVGGQVQSSRVFLGAPRPAPPRDARVFGPPEFERDVVPPGGGPGCLPHLRRLGGLGLADRRRSKSAPEDWILLEGELIADREEGQVRLCGLAGCADSAVAANVDMPPPDMDPRVGPLGGPRFIAHVRDGTLVDVTRVMFLGNAAP